MRGLWGTLVVVVLCMWMATDRGHAATTWYVDSSHTMGTQDGTSWATAFPALQSAIDPAQTGDTILVRGGVDPYRLTSTTDTFLIDDADADEVKASILFISRASDRYEKLIYKTDEN